MSPLTRDERVRRELDAMRTVLAALTPLNLTERDRVVQWVSARLAQDGPAALETRPAQQPKNPFADEDERSTAG